MRGRARSWAHGAGEKDWPGEWHGGAAVATEAWVGKASQPARLQGRSKDAKPDSD